MANLFVIRGRDQGKKFEFSQGCRIGRDAANDVQLLDGEASRRHASVELSDGIWSIVDHDSSNGTRVNDETIVRRDITNGDRIEIGSTVMIFTAMASLGGSKVRMPVQSDAKSPGSITDHGVQIVADGIDPSQSPEMSRIVSRLSPSSPTPGSPVGDGKIDVNQSLEVMYHASIAVGRTEDLDEVLGRVLKLVFDWTEADRGCVMLRGEQGREMHPAARCDRNDKSETVDSKSDHGKSDDGESDDGKLTDAAERSDDRETAELGGAANGKIDAEPIAISRTILDYVLASKQGVRTSDAQDDKRFDEAASILQARVREAICVPLQGRYGIVGVLYIDTDSSPGQIVQRGTATKFNDDHLRLMTAIGHQAAIAIEDTQHYSQLLQSERLAAMGQTIATLSHHVKNILQGIRGGSYLIQTGLDRDDNDAVRRGWSIVDRNQGRISNLVMDMLTYSKERTPELSDGDLNTVVDEVTELLRPTAAERGVELVARLDRSAPEAIFDDEAMHRAVMNLVTNAIDAASEVHGQVQGKVQGDGQGKVHGQVQGDGPSETVPRVVVSTAWCDGESVIEVCDTGPGIAPEDREKIFSLFESGKGSRGTGLGLPVCAKIMHEHQGRIEVADPPDGSCGAVFRLILPRRR